MGLDKSSKEYRKYRREISRKHRAKHPDKVRARLAGTVLDKQPCKTCGVKPTQENPTEAHHPDYKKPWKVDWYCKKHHEEVDTEQERKRRVNGTI